MLSTVNVLFAAPNRIAGVYWFLPTPRNCRRRRKGSFLAGRLLNVLKKSEKGPLTEYAALFFLDEIFDNGQMLDGVKKSLQSWFKS
jgi:hypothetical protein